LYIKDKTGFNTLQIISKAEKFNKWTYETIRPFLVGHILEIGSGLGNISSYAVTDNKDITLSDTDLSYVQFLKEKFSHETHVAGVLEIDIEKIDFYNYYQSLREGFDTIFILNVLEHVDNDALALQNCKHLLKSGGLLIVLVPAYPFLFSNIDRSLGHHRRYTSATLSSLLLGQGLKIVQSKYFNSLGILGWFFAGRVFRSKEINSSEMSTFNKIVPLARWTDKLFRRSFGLSIISIAKK
jgi:2-polyprenyl-3-methyl-5-hydroxy-6-metoxy-1,4-benzoquinol methylase